MKLQELKKEISEYQYMEDTNIIDITMASMITNRLKLGSPVWLAIVGRSSGGKSQILQPLARTDKEFIHELDDITESTFLSGGKVKDGGETSLLLRWGKHGIISIPDLTVLFSKSSESAGIVMSQFRKVYDGNMIKYVGNSDKAIEWKDGYMGMIAGCTPALYEYVEQYAEMGERFIYYRMKDEDDSKSAHLAMSRGIYGKELDEKLSGFYDEYIISVLNHSKGLDPQLSEEQKTRIIHSAKFAERVRTAVKMDFQGKHIIKIPNVASCTRVSLQLETLTRSLMIMAHHEHGNFKLPESSLQAIEWCSYSLANEEKRACLRVMAQQEFGHELTPTTIGDEIGLDSHVANIFLQNLAAVKILKKGGDGDSNNYKFANEEEWDIVRRMENITSQDTSDNRSITFDEF
jgi:hypothetical protein